jgi:hypothetical protein
MLDYLPVADIGATMRHGAQLQGVHHESRAGMLFIHG